MRRAALLAGIVLACAAGLHGQQARECVDLNTASFDQLRLIVHVDTVRAREIIAIRAESPFATVDQLTRVNGIGDVRLRDIRTEGLACVRATTAPPARAVPQTAPAPSPGPRRSCCRMCTTGKACGNSCINRNLTCRQPAGCACNAGEEFVPTPFEPFGLQLAFRGSDYNSGCSLAFST